MEQKQKTRRARPFLAASLSACCSAWTVPCTLTSSSRRMRNLSHPQPSCTALPTGSAARQLSEAESRAAHRPALAIFAPQTVAPPSDKPTTSCTPCAPSTATPPDATPRGPPHGAAGPLSTSSAPQASARTRSDSIITCSGTWRNLGKYATPPGWFQPPGYSPPWLSSTPTATPAAQALAPRGDVRAPNELCIPVVQPIVGGSSPFSKTSQQACFVCGLAGHAQYECPARFFVTSDRPIPGFLASGSRTRWPGAAATYLPQLGSHS